MTINVMRVLRAFAFALPFLAAQPAGAVEPDPELEMTHEGDLRYYNLLVDQLEYRFVRHGGNGIIWDAQGSYGGDINRVVARSEGTKVIDGDYEGAWGEILYSRAASDFFDAQIGARYDFGPSPRRTYAVFGIQGMAPYFFELEAYGLVSNEGEFSASFQAEYEILITNRLILQPKVELDFSGSQVSERGVGRGFTDLESGLRLRYEFTRQFAPYLGVNYERALGDTGDLAREEGEDVDSLALVAGVRLLF